MENIALPLELAGTLTKERKDNIDKLLELVGLTNRKHHRPDQLSGGEQQRIGVAAALANDPEIILCDEPTGELDSESKYLVMDLLKKIVKEFPNKTMIIVTHDAELKKIADRMYYIRDGRISYRFNKEELESIQTDEKGAGAQDLGVGSQRRIKEQVLVELREVNQLVKEKIDKIEKELHPI
jgi:putative ABC transport system ATP-binding protein